MSFSFWARDELLLALLAKSLLTQQSDFIRSSFVCFCAGVGTEAAVVSSAWAVWGMAAGLAAVPSLETVLWEGAFLSPPFLTYFPYFFFLFLLGGTLHSFLGASDLFWPS